MRWKTANRRRKNKAGIYTPRHTKKLMKLVASEVRRTGWTRWRRYTFKDTQDVVYVELPILSELNVTPSGIVFCDGKGCGFYPSVDIRPEEPTVLDNSNLSISAGWFNNVDDRDYYGINKEVFERYEAKPLGLFQKPTRKNKRKPNRHINPQTVIDEYAYITKEEYSDGNEDKEIRERTDK